MNGLQMDRLSTPKQRANAALKIIRALKRRQCQRQTARDAQQQEKSNDVSSSRHLKEEIGQILNRATKTTFKKAGLNIDDSEDWVLLLAWLAWAIYGKTAGRRKHWNKRELRQLNANVDKLRSENAKLTEADCCRELTNHPDYVGRNEITLLRRLQQAKKLDSKFTGRRSKDESQRKR
jgi:hypothetical protein